VKHFLTPKCNNETSKITIKNKKYWKTTGWQARRGWQNTFMAPDARLLTVHKKYNIQNFRILVANNMSLFSQL